MKLFISFLFQAVICVNLLFDSSSKRAVDKSVKCSPIIHYEHSKWKLFIDTFF